jgi:hypothetical protein
MLFEIEYLEDRISETCQADYIRSKKEFIKDDGTVAVCREAKENEGEPDHAASPLLQEPPRLSLGPPLKRCGA